MFTRRLTQIGLIVATVFMSVAVPAILIQTQTCEYWVAPGPAGNDAYPGTFALPWATLEHASQTVPDNYCTDWFKDGVYEGSHHTESRFATEATFRAVTPYGAILQYPGRVLEVHGGSHTSFEGFQFRHSGPAAGYMVVEVQQGGGLWAEHIVFRNNIFHDSYGKDLLRVHKLQDQFKLTLLSEWTESGTGKAKRLPASSQPAPDPKDPWDFFKIVNLGLTENPPPPDEAALLAEFARIGVAKTHCQTGRSED